MKRKLNLQSMNSNKSSQRWKKNLNGERRLSGSRDFVFFGLGKEECITRRFEKRPYQESSWQANIVPSSTGTSKEHLRRG
mmetsp:Transcript_16846/g.34686  ORF Transcript_16846/g.34686 Transcript_16846/m.34686 type:complete len:80 (-) Transcript_16846:177-416(-)